MSADEPWNLTPDERARLVPHVAGCDDEGCYCPGDVFWRRMLGDSDPCAPGKDWAAAAFTTPTFAAQLAHLPETEETP